ncbi:hypothetical protein QQP08_002201 [Theobroma cacao]|nr:hypothetical protein QQP08_002201 [Theobroma cacao]
MALEEFEALDWFKPVIFGGYVRSLLQRKKKKLSKSAFLNLCFVRHLFPSRSKMSFFLMEKEKINRKG